MDFKRGDMRKCELHRHMEQEKKLKDAIAFDDCPCTYSCCKLGRKCCGQGYCDVNRRELRLSQFYCGSFGNPQTQYCWDCDQLGECLDKKKEIRKEEKKAE